MKITKWHYLLAVLVVLSVFFLAVTVPLIQDRGYDTGKIRQVISNPGKSLRAYAPMPNEKVPKKFPPSVANSVLVVAVSPDLPLCITGLTVLLTCALGVAASVHLLYSAREEKKNRPKIKSAVEGAH